MSEHRDLDTGAFGLEGLTSRPSFSAADPDVLARAVRAHKAGDAFAQAAITFALMVAIGWVAFALSAERAAAASLMSAGGLSMPAAGALLAGICAAGCGLLVGMAVLRRRAVPVRRRDR